MDSRVSSPLFCASPLQTSHPGSPLFCASTLKTSQPGSPIFCAILMQTSPIRRPTAFPSRRVTIATF